MRVAILAAYLASLPMAALAQVVETPATPVAAPSNAEARNNAQTTRSNASPGGLPNIQGVVASPGQNDLCLGLRSIGYGSPLLGITLDYSRTDSSCRRIRTAKELNELGLHGAAIQVMCFDAEVRTAMRRAGTACESLATAPR